MISPTRAKDEQGGEKGAVVIFVAAVVVGST